MGCITICEKSSYTSLAYLGFRVQCPDLSLQTFDGLSDVIDLL